MRTKKIAVAGAGVLLFGALVGCSSSPGDASKDDFCTAMTKVGESSDFDDQKDAVKDLGDVGTPDDIGDDARKGFEKMLDVYDDADNADDLKDAEKDASGDEKDEGEAFSAYFLKKCLGDMPTGLPSGMPSELPSELSSDLTMDPSSIPSEMPSELPSEVLSQLPSDFPSSLLTMLPSEMPGN